MYFLYPAYSSFHLSACNCPFGLCHQVTGACICPPRVTGDRCDVCKPGSYGYDGLIGCQVYIVDDNKRNFNYSMGQSWGN